MQEVADNTSQWSHDNKMSANSIKTKDMIVNFSQEHLNIPNLIIDGAVVERVSTSKLLGVYISDDLTWGVHIKEIHSPLFIIGNKDELSLLLQEGSSFLVG